jgi:hypothetical protein
MENSMGHADFDLEELRDAAIAEQARSHSTTIATNIRTGHEQTLTTMAEDFACRVSKPGVTETLVRTAMACGPRAAGQMLIDLVQAGIDAEAELAAIKEVERMEAARIESRGEAMAEQRIWAIAMRDQSAFGGVA